MRNHLVQEHRAGAFVECVAKIQLEENVVRAVTKGVESVSDRMNRGVAAILGEGKLVGEEVSLEAVRGQRRGSQDAARQPAVDEAASDRADATGLTRFGDRMEQATSKD